MNFIEGTDLASLDPQQAVQITWAITALVGVLRDQRIIRHVDSADLSEPDVLLQYELLATGTESMSVARQVAPNRMQLGS